MSMGFFGGSMLDELQESHLSRAFEAAVPRSLAKAVDTREVFDGLTPSAPRLLVTSGTDLAAVVSTGTSLFKSAT